MFLSSLFLPHFENFRKTLTSNFFDPIKSYSFNYREFFKEILRNFLDYETLFDSLIELYKNNKTNYLISKKQLNLFFFVKKTIKI